MQLKHFIARDSAFASIAHGLPVVNAPDIVRCLGNLAG